MKKGKRTLTLSLSLLTLLTLTGCNDDYSYPDADWKDGLIVTVGGKEYKFEDIYGLFDNTKSSAQAYYTVAKNILAQLVTPRTDAILSRVDMKMNDFEDTWKTNARTNRTSYKEEMEKTFDSENVEDYEELRNKYIAEEQNTQNSNDFYTIDAEGENGYEYYISEQMTKDYVANQAPYHVSHILIKVDASSDGEGLWNGKISSDDAKQIGNVSRMLASSDTFGSIALIASDDEGSAKQYGELYTSSSSGTGQIAMEKTTSYINEFKLGLYAYEAYMNPETSATDVNNTVRASLRVPGEKATASYYDTEYDYEDNTSVSETIDKTLIGNGNAFGIPLSKAFTMGYVAELESNMVNGAKVDYASETQYPRNILFNNYFNYHGVNFMYDDSDEYEANFLEEAKTIGAANGQTINSINDVKTYLPTKYAEYEYVSGQLSKIDENKFQTISGISDKLYNYTTDASGKTTLTAITGSKKVLVEKDDGTTNPVIIVRGGSSSYQGIHFIVVNNDPFENIDTKYQYYRTNIPSATTTETDPTNPDTTDYSKNASFINYIQPDIDSNTTYNNRRDTIVSVIKAADSNIDFRLYESNLAAFKAKYNNKSFEEYLGKYAYIIQKYITTTRESTIQDAEDNLDESWETYVNQVALQQEVSPRGIVPEVCVSYFESGSLDGKESLCHVEK